MIVGIDADHYSYQNLGVPAAIHLNYGKTLKQATAHMGFLYRTQNGNDTCVLETRRLAAFTRIRRGESLSAIARSLGVSRQAVHQWAQSVRKCGAASLRRKPMGRPPKLSRKQMTQLGRLLAKTPACYGFPEQGWSPLRVSKLIHKYFGVRYDLYYIRPLLARYGWQQWSKKSPQKT